MSADPEPSPDFDAGAVLAWMSDAHGRCIHANAHAARYFAVGEDIASSRWNTLIHPEDRARILASTADERARRRAYQIEYRVLLKHGRICWKLEAASPRYADSGEFLGYTASIADVTAHHIECDFLMASEATHRFLSENSLDMISHLDPEGVFLYVTSSVRQVLGFEPEKIIGTNVFEHIHPADVGIISAGIAAQLNGSCGSTRLEFRQIHKDGHYVWIAATLNILLAPNSGQLAGFVSVCRDVSTERRAKEELKQREERFRGLTNLSSDWYWETDEHGRFTFVSDSVQRVFGIPAEKLLGRVCIDFSIEKDKPGLDAYFSAVSKREPFKDIRYSAHVRARNAICHASISGEPIFGNGIFKGYRGVGRDITHEIEAARELAALAAENKALIENSLDLMVVFDENGLYTHVNRIVLETFGYSQEELFGRPYFALVHPDDLERVMAAESGMRTGLHALQNFENRCIRKDGKVLYISWSGRWIEDEKLMYLTGRDITERCAAQAELQKSRAQLSTMLESIGDAFFALDNEWRVSYANANTADFVGRKQEDLIGKIVWEAVPEFRSSSVLPYYQRAMETRTKVFFEGFWEATQSWADVRIYPNEDGLAVFFHDITARRKSEDVVRASEQRLREMIEMTPAGYILIDGESIILEANLALCKMSGYSRDELIGMRYSELFSHFPGRNILFNQGAVNWIHGREGTLRHKDGHTAHALINANVKRHCDGTPLSVTAFLTEITERKQTEARLQQLANHDVLTGLPNRTFLNLRLQEILDSARKDESVAVMFIDLDRFKEVNDTLGHDPGDMLLREVARRLQSIMRPNDIVARLGGDEFIVVANCTHGKSAAAMIAEKLLSALTSPFTIENQEVFVTASLGISLFPQDGDSKEMLFKNADMAMYSAKAAGRNSYRFFESAMSDAAIVRMKLENALHHALNRNEFTMHFQPRIDLKSMHIVGVEALIRWNHPEFGSVPPLQFIPIAEENGLIDTIGNWVLRESCRQMSSLIDRTGHELRLSVNVSARQLKSKTLVQQVQSALQEARLPSRLLEVELTETALMEDMDISVEILQELKALGVLLAVDDFGTGYSGLAYLQRFPLDVLKLDRSFVNENAEGAKNLKFIKAFLDLAHALHLSVVAEGVESLEILNHLMELSCDEGQGYLFAKPQSMDELEKFLLQSDFSMREL